MTSRRPYQIKIFVPSGDPEGLRTIEKSNWNGCGLVFPRALLADAKKRKELNRTGVYLLVGPAEESGLPQVYIGEGDPIRPRLEQHAVKKDFWTTCIAFTSKDENLNKAHVQHLESRLYAIAAEGKRCSLHNGNVPQRPSLSEAEAAESEGFLDEVLLCLPLLGVRLQLDEATPARPRVALVIHAKGIEATGSETSQGFVVWGGSRAAAAEVPSCPGPIKSMRAVLIKNGVLAADAQSLRFTQDYVFPSPSGAACVVLGRSANGRTEWKTKEGKSLKALQDAEAKA